MTPLATSVLLIEDEQLVARVTEQMLRKAATRKYSLVHCRTLAEGLEKLRTENFDVLLLDLNLPDSSAMDTLQTVLAQSVDTPIIVLTATSNYEMGFTAIKLGAQDFLVKGDFNFLMLDRSIVYGIERHHLQRTIRQLAVLDELTGLYNRRGFNALHQDILLLAQQPGVRGYFCFFDLDRLKRINDELGHQAGDDALVEFASDLRRIFAKDALLVRLGGDEFVAMGIERAPNAAGAAIKALEIVLSVRNSVGPQFRLEASVGVAYFDQSGPRSMEELTAIADAALYSNKESRRQARLADPNPLPAVTMKVPLRPGLPNQG
jgi:diguanylate cyclase (GGDEF)-like protein